MALSKHTILFFSLITISGCTTYTDLLVSKDYEGDKIRVQRHADPCCGWAGLRFIYLEGKTKEHIIYFSWLEVPYAEKEVRTLSGKNVVSSEKYQLVFDTASFTEPLLMERGFGDTTKYDINELLLSTNRVKQIIPLNHIDSTLLFYAAHVLTNVNDKDKKMWLLDKAAGYIKGKRQFSYNSNGSKKIK